MMPKFSQSLKSDFLKTELSFENGAHFQREGLAKPGQRGLEKPGQAREGQKAKAASPGRTKKAPKKVPFFGEPRLPKSSPNRESAHLETELSFESRPPIEKEGLAKPGQSGRKEPGQETPKGCPGEPKGAQGTPEVAHFLGSLVSKKQEKSETWFLKNRALVREWCAF